MTAARSSFLQQNDGCWGVNEKETAINKQFKGFEKFGILEKKNVHYT